MLWHCMFSCCLRCWHPIWAKCQVLAASLLILDPCYYVWGGKNRHVPDDWAPVTQVEDLHATPSSWLLSLAWPSPSHCSYLGSEWSSGMISPSLCNFTFQVNWVYYTCTYTKKALVVDHHYSWILSNQHTCVLEHICNAKINTWAQLFFCFCQL